MYVCMYIYIYMYILNDDNNNDICLFSPLNQDPRGLTELRGARGRTARRPEEIQLSLSLSLSPHIYIYIYIYIYGCDYHMIIIHNYCYYHNYYY